MLGQPPEGNIDAAHPELGGAFDVARTAVDSAYMNFSTVKVAAASIPLSGRVSGPWGAYSTLRVSGASQFVLLHSGDTLSVTTSVLHIHVPAPAGVRAGTVTVSLRGALIAQWGVTTTRSLPAPSPWWKLLNG